MQIHIPVLKDEVVALFKDIKPGYYLDATLGYAGHASAILSANPALKLLACDQDSEAILYSKKMLENSNPEIQILQCNYEEVLKRTSLHAQIRAVLADIGVSSLQLDKNERGFSYESSELDMRMNRSNSLSAKNVVNEYSYEQLSKILSEFGELPAKLASDIASKIIKNRPINSCKELSSLIGNARLAKRSVALKTLVFQAIRIEVNNELGVLKSFLEQLSKLKDCLICIITFHSLEDKIVKETFKKWEKNCICDEFAIRCECSKNHSLGKIITKKPIEASTSEVAQNPRSSCAKLRAFYLYEK